MQAETFKWTTLLAFVTHIGEGRETAPPNREQPGKDVKRVTPEELQQLRASK